MSLPGPDRGPLGGRPGAFGPAGPGGRNGLTPAGKETGSPCV